MSAAAERVEEACRAGRLDGIDRLLADQEEHLLRAIAAAAAESIPDVATDRPPAAAAALDRVQLGAIARELSDLLRRRRIKARTLFIQFETAARAGADDRRIDAMAAALDRLDFEEAGHLLDEIVALLGLGSFA